MDNNNNSIEKVKKQQSIEQKSVFIIKFKKLIKQIKENLGVIVASLIVLTVVILLIVFLIILNQNNDSLHHIEKYKKPFTDPNNYEMSQLNNQIQMLQISDPYDTQQYALNVHIAGAGYFQDPIKQQGLSHLLLFTLMQGSTNYQNQDLISFIYSNGGELSYENSFNFSSITIVLGSKDIFINAVQRVVDMIIHPTLSTSIMNNEIDVLENINQCLKNNNQEVLIQILSIFAREDHPLHKDRLGGKSTLYPLNVTAFTEFKHNYYTPANIYLSVYSPEQNNQDIFNFVAQQFELIQDEGNNEEISSTGLAFDLPDLRKFIKVKKNTLFSTFTIVFDLPALESKETNNYRYILQALKFKSEIDFCRKIIVDQKALDCDYFLNYISAEEVLFGVNIIINELQGKIMIDEYLIDLFAFFKATKEAIASKPSYRWTNIRNEKIFKYQQQPRVLDQVIEITKKFQDSQNNDFIWEENAMTDFNEEEILMIIDMLRFDYALFILQSNTFSIIQSQIANLNTFLHINNNFIHDELRQLYYADYHIDEIEKFTILDKMVVEDWHFREHFDEIIKEKLIGVDNIYTLYNKNDAHQSQAVLSVTTDLSNLWFLKDISFKSPKVYFKILIEPKHSLITINFLASLFIYAEQSNLKFFISSQNLVPVIESPPSMKVNELGLEINCLEFSSQLDQLMLMLNSVLGNLNLDNVKDEEFSFSKKLALGKIIKNNLDQNTYIEGLDILYSIIGFNKLSNYSQLYTIIQSQSFIQYQTNMKLLLQNLHVEVLIGGNIELNEGNQWYNAIINFFKNVGHLQQSDYQSKQILNLVQKQGSYTIRTFSTVYDEYNSATVNYYQIGQITTLKQKFIAEYIKDQLKARTQKELRIKLHLGYHIDVKLAQLHDIIGLVFIVQSATHEPHYLDQVIETIFNETQNDLNALSSNIQLQIKKRSEDYILFSLKDQSEYNWNEILMRSTTTLNEQIQTPVSKNDILSFFNQYLKNQKAKISVQIYNKKQFVDLPQIILNETECFSKAFTTLYSSKDDLLSQETFNKFSFDSQPKKKL